MRPLTTRISLPLFTLLASSLCAQETVDPLLKDTPATELASFKMAPGFEANLFASEQDGVIKPIQIRWDARGRLWVVQSTTYPQVKPGEDPNDQILILEDTDGDGRSDKTTVFADGLMIPTGLELAPIADADGKRRSACYVGEGTKLWLLTDTDGDDKADKKEIVFRGFGTGDNHQNINSFRWSPGGELFFCQGLHANSRVETPSGISGLDEAGLWRMRPRVQELDGFYGGHADPQNPWGYVWTDWGQPIVVAGNSGGIFYPTPELIRGFQKGRRESIWDRPRARKMSGPDIVGTAHFPPDWQGRFLTGGYINNGVWTMKVVDDGAGLRMEEQEPLVTSTHVAFRPVDVKIGPDGAAYLCDWYNPIIGHYQASFRHPERDKVHGRIWRITAKGRELVKPPKIAGQPVPALLENLTNPERWVREQSKFELAGRPTDEVVRALRSWWPQLDPDGKETVHAWYEALGVFEWHETVEVPLLRKLLTSKNADARAYAVATVARWADRLPPQFDTIETLADLAHDENPRVRMAAITAAGNIPRPESMVVILAAPNPDADKFIDLAARAAVTALKPIWEPVLAKGAPNWKPEWKERLAFLQKAPEAPKPKKSDIKLTPAPAPGGKLRATPEFVTALVEEVRSQGNAQRGSEVYHRAELACIACHSLDGKGGTIGPALDTVGSGQPLDFIIGAVLEPQREIKESFEAISITSKDGKVAAGYLVGRDGQSMVVRDPASGVENRIALADIAERKDIGSFMPAGLVDNLSRADLRDLFAFLAQLGKPK